MSEIQKVLSDPLTKFLNPLVPNAAFLYPLKISETLTVFWCFQGEEKGCIGNEWVNPSFCDCYKIWQLFNYFSSVALFKVIWTSAIHLANNHLQYLPLESFCGYILLHHCMINSWITASFTISVERTDITFSGFYRNFIWNIMIFEFLGGCPQILVVILNKLIHFYFPCNYQKICGALRNLVPFAQFQKREKHPWRIVTFSKVAGWSLQLY